MLKTILSCCFLVTTFQLYASNFESIGADNKACGNILLNQNNVWSCFNHAASMTLIDKPCFGLLAERKFNINNFQTYSLAFIYPLKQQKIIGIGTYRFGDELFNFSRINLSFAKKIGLFSIGVSSEILQWHIEDHASTYKSIINLGGQAIIIKDKLWFGTNVINLLQPQLTNYKNELVPSMMSAGIRFKHSNQINVFLEYQMQTNNEQTPKFGLEYSPIQKLIIRLGVSSYNPNYHLGIGIKLNKLTIDYAVISHSQLNISQSLNLIFHPFPNL